MDVGRPYTLRRVGRDDVVLTIEKELAKGGQATLYKGNMTNLGDVVVRKILDKPQSKNLADKEVSSLKNSRLSAKANKASAENTEGCNRYINCFYGIIKHGPVPGGGGGGGGSPSDNFTHWSTDITPGFIYLIYEFIPGITLTKRLESPMTDDEIVLFGKQIIHAVEVIHEHNIVHFDLKPDNIMITGGVDPAAGTPMLKIIDFGLARPLSMYTRVPGGTPNYLPPEAIVDLHTEFGLTYPKTHLAEIVIKSLLIDPKSIDMFSVGCILYELITKTQLITVPFNYGPIKTLILNEPYTKYQQLIGTLLSTNVTAIKDIYEQINALDAGGNIKSFVDSIIRYTTDEVEKKKRELFDLTKDDEIKFVPPAKNTDLPAVIRNLIKYSKKYARTKEGDELEAANKKADDIERLGLGLLNFQNKQFSVLQTIQYVVSNGRHYGIAFPIAQAPKGAEYQYNPNPAKIMFQTFGSIRPSAKLALNKWCELNGIPAERCRTMAGGKRRSTRSNRRRANRRRSRRLRR
jgi:serine/threonine protein kinase